MTPKSSPRAPKIRFDAASGDTPPADEHGVPQPHDYLVVEHDGTPNGDRRPLEIVGKRARRRVPGRRTVAAHSTVIPEMDSLNEYPRG